MPGSADAAKAPSTTEQQQTREKPTRNTKPTKTATATPTNNKQKATTKSTPLRSNTNLPKATSTRGAFGNSKKSATADGSSFDAMNTAAVSATEEDENAVEHSTSLLAGLLPTLVAGLVFTTAGSMVGYLWNGEWAETASSVYNYYWGDGEATTEQSPSYQSIGTFESAEEEYNSAGGGGEYYSNNPAHVTPDRKHRDDHHHLDRQRDDHGRYMPESHHTTEMA